MKTPEKYSQKEDETTKADEGKQISSVEESSDSDDNDLLLAEERLRQLQTKEKTGIYLCAEGKKSGAICVTQEPNIKGKPRIGGIYLLKSFIKETKNDSVITTSERRIVKL